MRFQRSLTTSLRQSGQRHVRLRTKGYITVFLSLSLMIILSLVLALYQGARIGAVRMKTECVADISMNSVLAEYSRALYDRYGLLLVDSSYGSGIHAVTNTEEHLRDYAQKNFDRSTLGAIKNAQTMTAMFCKDVKLTGYSFATDNEGAVLKRQILTYMAAEPIGALMTDVLDNAAVLESSGMDSTDVEGMAGENQSSIDSIEMPSYIDEDGEEITYAVGNPADAVNSQKGIDILSLAIGSAGEISGAKADLSQYASHRQLNQGTGLSDTESVSASEKLLLDRYYYEKCGSYGAERERSLLKYQLEYLIYGEASDRENLNGMAKTLLFWREASNLAYLLGCGPKIAEVEAMAAALSSVALVPELYGLIKYSIILAWTFAESVSDLNILFSGGRVPLVKSDSTWRLGLEEMFHFRDNLGKGDCGEGLYYKDYLRIKLLMTSGDVKIKRMMDIIEMDIRQTGGNRQFMLDYCIDVLRAEFVIGTKYGYEASIERTYGYEY